MSISVLIVDDDTQVRGKLAQLIDSSPGCHCISQHASTDNALREIPRICPDVALIALNLPGSNGGECVRRLKPLLPAMQVIILTAWLDIESILNALSEGASGCLLKQSPPWELLHAIRDVHQGGSPLSSQIARKIVESFQKTPAFAPEMENLSPRQAQVLDLLAKGCSYREIAQTMQLTYATVHTHIRQLYKKLQVRSRHEAVARHSGRCRRPASIGPLIGVADNARLQEKSERPVMVAEKIL
jgi:DNA-binding NarL/FixJ family response regulator